MKFRFDMKREEKSKNKLNGLSYFFVVWKKCLIYLITDCGDLQSMKESCFSRRLDLVIGEAWLQVMSQSRERPVFRHSWARHYIRTPTSTRLHVLTESTTVHRASTIDTAPTKARKNICRASPNASKLRAIWAQARDPRPGRSNRRREKTTFVKQIS